jgi:hypothetical protein
VASIEPVLVARRDQRFGIRALRRPAMTPKPAAASAARAPATSAAAHVGPSGSDEATAGPAAVLSIVCSSPSVA